MRKKKYLFFIMAFAVLLLLGTSSAYAAGRSSNFKANGKKYVIKCNDDYGIFRLYQKTKSGEKCVAKSKTELEGLEYRFSYGKKIYFDGADDDSLNILFSYTPGKSTIKKEKNNLYVVEHSGKYAIGYSDTSGDGSPDPMVIYNLKTKKVKKLGYGGGIHIVGKKVYYAVINLDGNVMKIYRCNLDGSKKKLLKTVRDNGHSIYIPGNVTKNKVKYICMECDKTRTVKF